MISTPLEKKNTTHTQTHTYPYVQKMAPSCQILISRNHVKKFRRSIKDAPHNINYALWVVDKLIHIVNTFAMMYLFVCTLPTDYIHTFILVTKLTLTQVYIIHGTIKKWGESVQCSKNLMKLKTNQT